MNNDSNTKTFIQKLFSIIQWLCSIFFLVFGIAGASETIFTGLAMILLGLLLFPPIDKKLSVLYNKFKLNPTATKIILSIVLILFAGSMIPENKFQIAAALYQEEKIEAAISKLNEIKPKNIDEQQKKEKLIKEYSDNFILYKQDKNLFFYNQLKEAYDDKAYDDVSNIFNKIEEKSTYKEKALFLKNKLEKTVEEKIQIVENNNENYSQLYKSLKILEKKTYKNLTYDCFEARISMDYCNDKELLYKVLEEFYFSNASQYDKVLVWFYYGDYAKNCFKSMQGFKWIGMINKFPPTKTQVLLQVSINGVNPDGQTYSKYIKDE